MDILVSIFGVILFLGFMLLCLYMMLGTENPLKLKINAYFTGKEPGNCTKCKKLIPSDRKKCSGCSFAEGVGDFVALFAVAVGGLVLAKIIGAGFSFLRDVDVKTLNPAIQEAIELASVDINSISNNQERLRRAEALLDESDKISTDQAAMLTCATLECGLKTLAQRNYIENNLGEHEGMVDLAIRLSESNVISDNDLRGIKSLVYRVRNPVMHGDFDKFAETDVLTQIHFTRELFARYEL